MKYFILSTVFEILCIYQINSEILIEEEINYIKGEINKARREVNPAAADMLYTEWDAALATEADTEAKNCKSTGDPKSGKFVSHTFSDAQGTTVQTTLNTFLKQKTAYNPQTRKCTSSSTRCQDFLQIVYRNSEKVGCGKMQCNTITGVSGSTSTGGLVFVCIYTEPQVENGEAYTIGTSSCDSCPQGYTCEDKLCKRDTVQPSGSGGNTGNGSGENTGSGDNTGETGGNTGSGGNPGSGSSSITPLTEEEKVKIINKVLTERRGVEPPAGDMKLSKWSNEFSTEAAKLVDGCTTTATEIAGKNVLIVTDSNASITIEKLIEKFLSQKANYDANTRKCKSDNNCGLYKQIIYKDMTMLGCAKKFCAAITGVSGAGIVFACVFKEPDVLANSAYTVGEKSCDKCPEEYRCDNKLCSKDPEEKSSKTDKSSDGVTTNFHFASILFMCLFVKLALC